MLNCLEVAGVTPEADARVIREAQSAEKIEYFSNKEGEVTDERRHPDHAIRLQAAKLSMQLRGALKDPAESGGINLTAIFAKITQVVRDRGLPLAEDH